MASELPPLYRLGIVGAGQIARMTHAAALQLGITPRLLAEDFGDSAVLAAPDAVFTHPDALASFVQTCEVVTFEHERLDIGLLERLEADGMIIRPGVTSIRAAFDKMHQRRVLLNRGFNVPIFAELRSPDELLDFTNVFDWPAVIKSVRAGLPGQRSHWIVENRSEAMAVISEQQGRDLMIENYQAIVKELVVLVARRPGGAAVCYPVAEAVMSDGHCKEIRFPAEIGPAVGAEARELALKLANELDAVGILAVEFFLTPEGLVINELAARPHNAGHLTIEGCTTSQFENHVRAVLDLPLGPTRTNAPAIVTVNVVGGYDGVDPSQHLADALAVEGIHVHLYGKSPFPGRKLGHVTALGDDLEQASELARRGEAALMGHRAF